MRCVVRRVATMEDGLVWFGGGFTTGTLFQTGGLAYDNQSYLLRRKMVHYTSVLTSMVLTTSLRKITIHSHSSPIYWTYLTKLGFIQR